MNGQECVPLSTLVGALLQKAYHDLTVLAELLPRKSDLDRKLEIVQFARQTRLLLIRLLALVKWAGNSGSVQKCSEMSAMLRQRSWLYVDTADQLVHLARTTLVQACMPNFSLATALDVLSSGSYPRLPTCIQERIVPPSPLSGEEKLSTFSLIECTVRRRLLQETIPEAMRVKHIGRGMVTFVVPYEFELSLSVVSDDLGTPWRLVRLRILVGDALPEHPVLVHELQQLYLHQLVQSRLFAEETPLLDTYLALHAFCLALQLDCLHSQAVQLVYGGYVKVDEYYPGKCLKLTYWRPTASSELLSAFLLNQSRVSSSWPKVIVSIDPTSPSKPFSTVHLPPLPGSEEVGVAVGQLSAEGLLERCVCVRSQALLRGMKDSLRGTPWEELAVLRTSPLCLMVRVPVKSSEREVCLSVDPRLGQVVAGVPSPSPRVLRALEELEKAVSSSLDALPTQLSILQCQLFLDQLEAQVAEMGFQGHAHLPLATPLPLQSSGVLYVELQPLVYLVVAVAPGLIDHYHLLQLVPASSGVQEGAGPVPQSLYEPSSLIEVDIRELQFDHLHAVLVRETSVRLKRKLRDSHLELPSAKRLCVWRDSSLSSIPALVHARLSLRHMQDSLSKSDFTAYHVTYAEHGALCIHIFNFPQILIEMGSTEAHTILSSCMQSCQVSPNQHGYYCRMVFSQALEGVGGVEEEEELVVPLQIPLTCDLGQALIADWKAKVGLLTMATELQQYLQDPTWPLYSKCSISAFSYSKLVVAFWKHTVTVCASGEGLRLFFSDACPHALLSSFLEKFLNSIRSLPLLLQGLRVTEKAISVLEQFIQSTPGTSVTASTPSQLQLRYDNLSLSMSLLADSTVELTDLSYTRPTVLGLNGASGVAYLQAFLHSTLPGEGPSEGAKPSPPPLPPSQPSVPPTRMLMPSPTPIMSPWPGSPLPSIPPLPSPTAENRLGVTPLQHSWAFYLSLEQLETLFSPRGLDQGSPVEAFLGSLALLYQCAQVATADRYQQPQLQFVSSDRGVCTYRTDSLSLSLSLWLETAQPPSLKLTLKPQQESVWSVKELQTVEEFFKTEVSCHPFLTNRMNSFTRLLLLPLPTLKSCVQLMQLQMHPPLGLQWRVSICLTVPPGVDLGDTPVTAGTPGVIYKGRLLIFVKLSRVGGGEGEHVVPVMHDPKSNATFIARSNTRIHHSPAHQTIDSVLRKYAQEYGSASPESSLFPALRAVSQSSLFI